MSKCRNHPQRESLSICITCKDEFCEDCLDEGEEYYYCKKPECQMTLQNEKERFDIPEDIICPNCESELELTKEERLNGKIRCPECELPIDCTSSPPKILKNEDYHEILSSLNQGDIGLIKSILDDGNIDYFTLGEHFLSVRPLLQPVRILINVKQVEIALELLKDLDLKIFGYSSRQDKDFN